LTQNTHINLSQTFIQTFNKLSYKRTYKDQSNFQQTHIQRQNKATNTKMSTIQQTQAPMVEVTEVTKVAEVTKVTKPKKKKVQKKKVEKKEEEVPVTIPVEEVPVAKQMYSLSTNGVPIGITGGFSARYNVYQKHLGFIIGKGGGNVKRIRDNTQCQILIQEPDEESSGFHWFLVRGLFKKNVERACAELNILETKAFGLIDPSDHHLPQEIPNPDTYAYAEVKCSYLIVHPSHVGMIVGKKGKNVTRISRDNGAFVYIQKGNASTGGMPWFQIKGLYERNIESAFFALIEEATRAAFTINQTF
jgi:predicted PilT family ATPase